MANIEFGAMLMCLAVCVLAVIRVEIITRRSRPAPPALPVVNGPCVCKHEKSFHNGGTGRCNEVDLDKVYVSGALKKGSPPCECRMYIPKEQPAVPAVPPPPAVPGPGGYDPVYTAFLEWWGDNWNTIEGTRK